MKRSRSTAQKRKLPDGWPPPTRLLTCRGTRSTLGPSMPRRGCPSTAPSTGCARSTATNPGTTNCAPKPSIMVALPCTPTLRRIQGYVRWLTGRSWVADDPLAGSARDERRLWPLVRTQNMAICSVLLHRTASGSRVRDERVTGWEAGGRLRQSRQQNMPICRMFSTGATGLEPATSGVTGRSWRFRAERGQAGTPAVSRVFRPRLCGDSRCARELPAGSCGMSAGCCVA
jgi:hypothetical protein